MVLFFKAPLRGANAGINSSGEIVNMGEDDS